MRDVPEVRLVLLNEQDVEFDRLRSLLDISKIEAFARQTSAIASLRFNGNCDACRGGRSQHPRTVADLAVRYVVLLYRGEDRLEQRYVANVCEAAALLHESMLQACSFEDLVATADEAVANIVAAMTPDLREPPPKRLKLLSNRIGQADGKAQLVMLADLRHECAMQSRRWATVKLVSKTSETAAKVDTTLQWVDDATTLLGHLRRLTDTQLDSRIRALRTELGLLTNLVKARA